MTTPEDKNVPQYPSDPDHMYQIAEQLAVDFSLFPQYEGDAINKHVDGLVSVERCQQSLQELRDLDIDQYIERVVAPSEHNNRTGAKTLVRKLAHRIITELDEGPLYAAEIEIDFGLNTGKNAAQFSGQALRRLGVLCQNREHNKGVWLPRHHRLAAQQVRNFAKHGMPIVTFIDTPGADAGEDANAGNQAHSISQLIAEMANSQVPTLGIIWGAGYSGGAIPLATTNLLLSVRDGIFNTIQPQGLANIARKYNLSWQECAKYVGVSAYELQANGVIDGIVDYAPSDAEELRNNLLSAIVSGIRSIERGAENFARENPYLLDHYQRAVTRFLSPSDKLLALQRNSSLRLAQTPTEHLNVFGITYRYLRYLSLRGRVHATTVENYGRLSEKEIPQGQLSERLAKESQRKFQRWLKASEKIVYDDTLHKLWKQFLSKREGRDETRNTLVKMVLGEPKDNYLKAKQELCFNLGLYLFNRWKADAAINFQGLMHYLEEHSQGSAEIATTDFSHADVTILEVIQHYELRDDFVDICQNMLVFGELYDHIIRNLVKVAKEANESRHLSKYSVKSLLETSLAQATEGDSYTPEEREAFDAWLGYFVKSSQRGGFLKSIEEWKKLAFPQLSDTLFVIITVFFEKLLAEYHEAEHDGKGYSGRITPVSIGRRKDFWNRLTMAYHDLLIQQVLSDVKRQKKTSAAALIDRFFSDFHETHANLMSADPVSFPGFRNAIEQALNQGITPCGVITGIGTICIGDKQQKVGTLISNLDFQAGAFDMASAEKFCKLMVECARQQLPIVCFVSSGGMQTKEGAAALFSMAIVNDRMSRFIRDNDLPIIMFGFGDCTGGAQASFVTHPMAQTYYFSGTNMPFAGQIVVPSYLPSTVTLSNYLSISPDAMTGLVKHPFFDDLDERLKAIDPDMPVARHTVDDVLARVLEGYVAAERLIPETGDKPTADKTFGNIDKVLVHARGCTAVKLVRKAQENDIQVVLVQSDPDMDSVPVDLLREQDRVVCIGGNTPDESYLNALSVLRVAQHEQIDALHPGIGFLSESSQFAALCGNHGINFVGPSVSAMETMGNKSNAINTALAAGVPVVPGSHGILTSSANAASVAEEIGYPVLLKAVHGGGGKGIQVVEDPQQIHTLFHQIATEAKAAFGNGDVYLEKYVTSLRHIEVQILRDSHGNTRVLGLRDCSVQRNNQKIFEESGSTLLPPELEQSVYDYAAKLADAVAYVGAGTVEFIYNLDANAIYFMEMNTRLQVEHPVTELVSGIDIVSTQFNIAEGGAIADLQPAPNGYAIEVRINAEKAVRKGQDIDFVPTPGTVIECELPKEDHIELISCIAAGKEISPFYDSLVVQIICHGRDRDDTIQKLRGYLERVRITGVSTNIPLVKRVLDDDVFLQGDYDTNYLPAFLTRMDAEAMIAEMEAAAAQGNTAIDASAMAIEGSDEVKVLSPSTSIFYGSVSPTEPPYVKEGDIISVDQTLCLMEAMKMFSSLSLKQFNREGQELYPAHQLYQVTRILNTDGQQVNRGDLLFVVKPVEAMESAA